MSTRKRTEDNIQDRGNTTDSPKVLIVSTNPNITVNSSYSNFSVSKNGEILSGYDFYCFLDKYYNFTNENSLQRIVDYLASKERAFLLGAYSDILVTDKNNGISFVQYLPSFDINLIRNRFTFNVPFIVKKQLLPTFNENIESLRLWDGFLSIVKNALLFHIPEPLFQLDNAFDTTLISKDLELINETHYKAHA